MALQTASRQLFTRPPDERFKDISALFDHCKALEDASRDQWVSPRDLSFFPADDGTLRLGIGSDGAALMSDWSFGQVCRLAQVSKETVNKVRADTAARIFHDTLPRNGGKPLQLYCTDEACRSIHGHVYTRLLDTDLLKVIKDYDKFVPPPVGFNGATGVYGGDRDVFVFLIDPESSLEVANNVFHPGLIAYNSTVGARAVGLQTFYYQRVCGNHQIHGVRDFEQFTAKHTSKVADALDEIRRRLDLFCGIDRSAHDDFVATVKKASRRVCGKSPEEALKFLTGHGITQRTAAQAVENMADMSIWSAVDSLTRMSRTFANADDRLEADKQAAKLLKAAT